MFTYIKWKCKIKVNKLIKLVVKAGKREEEKQEENIGHFIDPFIYLYISVFFWQFQYFVEMMGVHIFVKWLFVQIFLCYPLLFHCNCLKLLN